MWGAFVATSELPQCLLQPQVLKNYLKTYFNAFQDFHLQMFLSFLLCICVNHDGCAAILEG